VRLDTIAKTSPANTLPPLLALLALLLTTSCFNSSASAEPLREENALLKARFVGEHDLFDLVRYTWTDGWLDVEFLLPVDWAGPEAVRTDIKGSNATWIWKISAHRDGGDARSLSERVVELQYRDAGSENTDGHTRATLYSHDGYLMISGRLRQGDENIVVFYRGRTGGQAELEAYVQEDCALTRTLLTARGENLERMAAAHPEEVERYFTPLLRKISRTNLLGPGATDVYATFPEIHADDGIVSRVEQLLPVLDSPDVRDRERATRELALLGRQAVLAAMRWDKTALSPEQAGRLQQLVESHRRRRAQPVESAHTDLTLLIECLSDDDLAVRTAAKDAIETLLGHAIAFDPSLDLDGRALAVDGFRASLTVPRGGKQQTAVTRVDQ
jgi:hypothetical protein